MDKKLLKPTEMYRFGEERLRDLYRVRAQLTERLENAPPGKIHYAASKNKVSYYFREDPGDTPGQYIPKKEEARIRNLLQKNYDEKAIKLVESEIRNLERLFKRMDGDEKLRVLYDTFPQRSKTLIHPVDISDTEYIRKWMSIPYDRKLSKEGTTLFVTDKGDYVRSKSEVNISNELYKRDIPYKYECPLKLRGGKIIHPDYTILDIRTRKVIYWEHRGKMDDRDYARDAVRRFREYMANNIYPGDNLILTEETSMFPLSTAEIRRMIEHYFGG